MWKKIPATQGENFEERPGNEKIKLSIGKFHF